MFDPICGMWLEPEQVAITYTYLGRSYGFCCTECRDLFARVPEAHLARLAHEPGNSAGHLCPYQRLADKGPAAGSEEGPPGK